MTAVNLAPTGRTFVRGLIAQTMAKDNAEAYARNRWGVGLAGQIAKAAVPAMLATDPAGTPEGREFFALAVAQSLLGRIAGLRRVPFNVRALRQTSGIRGYWVGEGKPIPLSSSAMEGFTLAPLRVGSIIVQTKEAVEAYGEVAEAALQRDLLTALTASLDDAFIDPSNAGTADEVPASVTNGGTQIASTGNAKTDIERLFAAYEGNYRTAVIAMHPLTAVQIGLLDAQVGDTKLGVQGGILAGVPVVCSESVPLDSSGAGITLLDAGSIAYAARDFELAVSGEASLQMADDPTDGATTQVSLFQTNCVAWKGIATANWEVQGSGRVVTITGANYAGA